MHRLRWKKRLRSFAVLMAIVCWCLLSETVHAEDTDYETDYQVILEDDADLLTDLEEEVLEELMQEVAVYGNVAFKTIDYNQTSTENYIEDYYESQFGYENGTVFLIDMDNRNIWIYSDGAIYDVITKSYANTITDNVYTYASDEEYYECAYHVFDQMLTLLQGNKIAQPMKYISNAFLALILALLVNYFLVKLMSVSRKPNEKQLLEATKYGFQFENPEAIHTHTTRRYDPPSSSSGGGGGRSGGGRSGGGGGGHRF